MKILTDFWPIVDKNTIFYFSPQGGGQAFLGESSRDKSNYNRSRKISAVDTLSINYESKIPHLEKWIPNQLLLPSHGHQHKQLIGQLQKPTIFSEAFSPVQGSTDRLYFIGPGFFKIFGRSGSRFPNFYWSLSGLVLEPDRLVMNKSVLIRWSLPVRKTIQKKKLN